MDNKKIKVLIGDDSAEYGITCANELRALGLYVVTRRKDGKVILDAIRNDTPDVVVMDAVLPGMDAIEILEKSQTFAHAPAFIITSSYENTFIERQVMEKGAAYFMLKPFHISALGNRITELASNGIPDKEASAHRTLEMVVTEMIHQLGVPAHIKGYHYLRAAILASIENQALLESVTKMLYPTVAQQFDTTSSRVERAIRHAIEIAWDHGQAAAAVRKERYAASRLKIAALCEKIYFLCVKSSYSSALFCGTIKTAICSLHCLSAGRHSIILCERN